jgi:hypothetical protein
MDLHISIRDDDVSSKLYGLLVAMGSVRTESILETRNANQGYDNCTTAQCGVSDEGIGLGAQVVMKGALIPGDSFYGHATTLEISSISNASSELPMKKPADVLIGVIDLEKS